MLKLSLTLCVWILVSCSAVLGQIEEVAIGENPHEVSGQFIERPSDLYWQDDLLGKSSTGIPLADNPHDVFWDDRFTTGSLNGTPYTVSFDHENNLYVGGWFSTAGKELAQKVAKWDGSSWSSLVEFDPNKFQGYVSSFVFDEDGTLYGGGWDPWNQSNVAKYDGNSWSDLWVGPVGTINTMLMDKSGDLYAGGSIVFDNSRASIVKWDGSSWKNLGDGLDGPGNPQVYGLALNSEDHIYAGGNFDSSGTIALNGVAKWDGLSWSPLGIGVQGYVNAVAVDSEDHLYVAGFFDTAGNVAVQNIAMWNGETWSSLGDGLNGRVGDLVIDQNGNLVATAFVYSPEGLLLYGYIAKWDGNSWTVMDDELESFPHGIALDKEGALVIVGIFRPKDGSRPFKIAKWSGGTWVPFGVESDRGLGLNGGVRASASDGNGEIYLVGSFSYAGEVKANGAAMWDGNSWTAIDQGLEGNDTSWFTDLVRAEDGTMYASSIRELSIGGEEGQIIKWDGVLWSVLPKALMVDGRFARIEVLSLGPDGCLYAGGIFQDDGSGLANGIARWDGNEWSSLGTGLEEGNHRTEILSLAFDQSGGDLYVGGNFSRAGGKAANNIARWDGNEWHALGSGLSSVGSNSTISVRALTFDNGLLYAGGNFDVAGNSPSSDLASWDGNKWTDLGLTQNIKSLETDSNGHLYAMGQINLVGDGITRWDGLNWNPLGSGVRGGEMQFDGLGSLYVSGSSIAGNRPSSGIARWDIDAFNAETSTAVSESPLEARPQITVFPNPSSDFATIYLDLRDDQKVEIGLYDIMGKLLREIPVDLDRGQGEMRFGIDNSDLANGSYVLKVTGKSWKEFRVMTVLK